MPLCARTHTYFVIFHSSPDETIKDRLNELNRCHRSAHSNILIVKFFMTFARNQSMKLFPHLSHFTRLEEKAKKKNASTCFVPIYLVNIDEYSASNSCSKPDVCMLWQAKTRSTAFSCSAPDLGDFYSKHTLPKCQNIFTSSFHVGTVISVETDVFTYWYETYAKRNWWIYLNLCYSNYHYL